MKTHQTTGGEVIGMAMIRSGYKGRQTELCHKTGITESTLKRRKRDPGSMTLSEYWSLDRFLHFTDWERDALLKGGR